MLDYRIGEERKFPCYHFYFGFFHGRFGLEGAIVLFGRGCSFTRRLGRAGLWGSRS